MVFWLEFHALRLQLHANLTARTSASYQPVNQPNFVGRCLPFYIQWFALLRFFVRNVSSLWRPLAIALRGIHPDERACGQTRAGRPRTRHTDAGREARPGKRRREKYVQARSALKQIHAVPRWKPRASSKASLTPSTVPSTSGRSIKYALSGWVNTTGWAQAGQTLANEDYSVRRSRCLSSSRLRLPATYLGTTCS